MAEMTASEAIKVLHNNQYQKHIGNGEYDYIHPLTDAEAKGIEKLIEHQAAEIAKLNDKADAMRCCANCISHHVIINESKCFEGLPIDEWRFSKRAKPVDCDYVCDKWKWLEKEAEVHG